MPYDYAIERPRIFTEDGLRRLLAIDNIARLAIEKSGAVHTSKLMAVSVDSYRTMACIDFLEEIGRIRCCTKAGARNDWIYF